MAQHAQLSGASFEAYARRFLDNQDPTVRLQLAVEVRDGLEVVHTSEYGSFLKYLFPVFYNILRQGTPQLGDGPEQKVRNVLLEVLNRLPNTELLRPFAGNLLKLSMYLLEVENEENAVICLRIIIELHKNYRPHLDTEVQPFLDIVHKFYSELPKTLQAAFSEKAKPPQAGAVMPMAPGAPVGAPPGAVPTPAQAQAAAQQAQAFAQAAAAAAAPFLTDPAKPTTLIRSTQSFKVLTECPIIVVLLFQLYPKFLAVNIPKFMPLIVNTLSLHAPERARLSNRPAYADFVAAQVKTLSFLAYLLRGYSEAIKPYADNIPRYVTELLQNCPPESAATRKELLIATRHIFATDFRTGFVPQTDQLLDERVLVGAGRMSYETLRPLAFSTLADLVHHIRNDLSLSQLSRVIHLYARNIHDTSLPFSIQTMSAKLLLNLVECIARKNQQGEGEGRVLLVRILDAFVNKFSALRRQIPRLTAAAAASTSQALTSSASGASIIVGSSSTPASTTTTSAPAANASSTNPTPMDVDSGNAEDSLLLPTGNNPVLNSESVRECRLLMKTLVLGLKNIVWGISSCAPASFRPTVASTAMPTPAAPPTAPPGNPGAASNTHVRLSTVDETAIYTRLLRNGLRCLALYGAPPAPAPHEEKDILGHFAAVFAMVEARLFQDVFALQLPFLFDSMLENAAVAEIPEQFLLSRSLPTPSVSRMFAELLLAFLLERLKRLATPDRASQMLLRLWALLCDSVAAFPDNEAVLQPHLVPLISAVLQQAAESRECANHFTLLKALYRAVSGGKLDVLHRELHPLAPHLLDALNRLLLSSHVHTMKPLLCELALTIPLKLALLAPHIGLLVRPMHTALEAIDTPELCGVALRQLELLLECLAPDLLRPLLTDDSLARIVPALYKFVSRASTAGTSPLPFGVSHVKGQSTSGTLPITHDTQAIAAVRILGKLGGRARRLLERASFPLGQTTSPSSSLRLMLEGAPSPVHMPIAKVVSELVQLISKASTYESHVHIQAARLLRHLLLPLLLVNRTQSATPVEMDALPSSTGSAPTQWPEHGTGMVDLATLSEGDDSLLDELLLALVRARATEPMRSLVANTFTDAARYTLAVWQMPDASAAARDRWPSVLITALCDEQRTSASAACEGLEALLSPHVPMLAEHLLSRLLTASSAREWHAKSGTAQGIGHICSLLGPRFVRPRQQILVRNLLAVLRDTATDGPNASVATAEAAISALQVVLKLGNTREGGEEPDTQAVVALLAAELAAVSAAVRKAVQTCLEGLAQLLSIDQTELLSPHRDRLLTPMFLPRPLRTLTVVQQTGVLDAVTHCLQLRPPLLPFTTELHQVLQEALTIAEMDEVPIAKPVPAPTPASAGTATTQPGAAAAQTTAAAAQVAGGAPAGTAAQGPAGATTATGQTDANATADTGAPAGTASSAAAAASAVPPPTAVAPTPAAAAAPKAAPSPPAPGGALTLSPAVRLRMAAVELLAAAMGSAESYPSADAQLAELRNRVIAVFFKALTFRSKEVVAVARRGLAQVIHLPGKLPKDILQASLRPVLLNLADHKKLSYPLLQGLSRLLELLTNCFNVTLGEKLLEHLTKMTEQPKPIPGAPPAAAAKALAVDGEASRIATAIIEIFHQLPSAAVKFLESLVVLTIQLEHVAPREASSPYRPALLKFLNRYPAEAVEHFLARLASPQFARLFRHMIRAEGAVQLREELAKATAKLISSTFHAQPVGSNAEVQYQGVVLVRALVRHTPNWLALPANRPILDCLVELWRTQSRAPGRNPRVDDGLPLHHGRETKLLVKCFVSYCRAVKEEVDLLFLMLTVFTSRATLDFTFLRDYYTHEVAQSAPLSHKQKILQRFIILFREGQMTNEHKVQTLQLLIIPLLSHALRSGDAATLLDAPTITAIVTNVLSPPLSPSPPPAQPPPAEEALSIELLQLATLLVRHLPQALLEHRKELIKFAWNHLKSDDTTAKHCAYVLVCHFIAAYDTPPKIILQVYIALLRAFQPEARHLVRHALDILTPALQKRLPAAGADARYPGWVKWTKKIVMDEGHATAQLTHIMQLLVRHASLFYASRDQFALSIVNNLGRTGLPPQAPPENRKLALDLVDLLIGWERRRLEERRNPPVAAPAPLPLSLAHGPDAAPLSPMEGVELGKRRAEHPSAQQAGTQNKALKTSVEEGSGAKPAAAPPGAAPHASSPVAGDDLGDAKPSASLEMIANFLVRMAAQNPPVMEPTSPSATAAAPAGAAAGSTAGSTTPPQTPTKESIGALNTQALELLKGVLQLWPEVPIKFAYLEKMLGAAAEQPAVSCTALAVLRLLLEFQLVPFLQANGVGLAPALTAVLASDHPRIMTQVSDVLTRILSAYPLSKPASEFIEPLYRRLAETLEAGLQAQERTGALPALSLLRVLTAELTAYADPYLGSLVKCLTRVAREHTTAESETPASGTGASTATSATGATPGNAPAAAAAAVDPKTQAQNAAAAAAAASAAGGAAAKQGVRLSSATTAAFRTGVRTAVTVLASRHAQLGEHRKAFLNALALLIERSSDIALLEELAPLIASWIRDPLGATGPALTSKERVTLLLKMSRFDSLGRVPNASSSAQMLQGLFLDLVLAVYNDSTASRAEIVALEPAFMAGLRAGTPQKQRAAFFQIFHRSIGRSPSTRLWYVLGVQNWEHLAGDFWVAQVMELLLALALPPSAPAQFPLVSTSAAVSMQWPALPSNAPSDYIEWLRSAFASNAADAASALAELCHASPAMAHVTSLALFPALWTQLTKDDQQRIAKATGLLLARDFNAKQSTARPNVVSSLLECAALCAPAPRIPPEVLRHAARHFGAWYASLRLLETALSANAADEKSIEALSDVYAMLGEHTRVAALWQRRAAADDTRVALSLEVYGCWEIAQVVFFNAMSRTPPPSASSSTSPSSSSSVMPAPPTTGGVPPVSKAEIALWQREWIACARRLQQWEVLADFARACHLNQAELLLESCWKLGEWGAARDALPKALQAAPEAPRLKLCAAYVALSESRHVDVLSVDGTGEGLVAQAVTLALKDWQRLPPLPSRAHSQLVQLFQQATELAESATIARDLSPAAHASAPRHQSALPEVRATLAAWRERLPLASEDPSVWYEVLVWRQQVFSLLNAAFAPLIDQNNTVAYLGHHETAWTINRFAHAARKHRLLEACVAALNRIYQLPNIEILDAFTKLKEQVKTYAMLPCPPNSAQLQHGLDIILSTNLDYFTQPQKSHFFTLKAELQQRLGHVEDANAALAAAVNLSDSNGKAWLTWSGYADKQLETAAAPLRGRWAEASLSALLQAMRAGAAALTPGGIERTNRAVARAIMLLLDEEELAARLASGQAPYSPLWDSLPAWLFLDWLPLLIATAFPAVPSPLMSAAALFRQLLVRIVALYPQSVFYPLHAHTAHLRRHGKVPGSQRDADEMLATLRAGEGGAELEAFMNAVHTASALSPPAALAWLIGRALLPVLPAPSTASARPYSDHLHAAFEAAAQYARPSDWPSFRATYAVHWSADFARLESQTVASVRERLMRWLARLNSEARHSTESSHVLTGNSLELPLHVSTLPADPALDLVPRVERIDSVATDAPPDSPFARMLCLRTTDGRTHYLGVDHADRSSEAAEQRLAPLLKMIARLTAKHRLTRLRATEDVRPVLRVPGVGVRLLVPHLPLTNPARLWRAHCTARGLDPDAPAAQFAQMRTNDSQAAYESICTRLVPDNLISRLFTLRSPSLAHLFHLKRQFATHLALQGALGHILSVPARSASQLVFSAANGACLPLEWRPSYAQNGTLATRESLRLTRNITSLLSPLGIDADYVPAFTSLLIALSEGRNALRLHLALYLRDDLASSLPAEPPQAPDALRQVSAANLQTVQNRITALTAPFPLPALASSNDPKKAPTTVVSAKVQELVQGASSPAVLSAFEPSWQAWL